jgi:hypothetical protein
MLALPCYVLLAHFISYYATIKLQAACCLPISSYDTIELQAASCLGPPAMVATTHWWHGVCRNRELASPIPTNQARGQLHGY